MYSVPRNGARIPKVHTYIQYDEFQPQAYLESWTALENGTNPCQ